MASKVIQSATIKHLRTGAHVAVGALDSTGYIVIQDEDGTDRKLMVQA